MEPKFKIGDLVVVNCPVEGRFLGRVCRYQETELYYYVVDLPTYPFHSYAKENKEYGAMASQLELPTPLELELL